jgi:hypothetical protein
VVIQNGSARNGAIPTAVALTELVQIWAPRNVGIPNDLARNAVIQSAPALRFFAGLRHAQVAHSFAAAIQALELVIHSAAQVAPAQFAHDA